MNSPVTTQRHTEQHDMQATTTTTTKKKRKKKTKASNTRQPADEAALVLSFFFLSQSTHSSTLRDCVTMKKKKWAKRKLEKGFDDAQTARAGVHDMSCPCVCLSIVTVSVCHPIIITSHARAN